MFRISTIGWGFASGMRGLPSWLASKRGAKRPQQVGLPHPDVDQNRAEQDRADEDIYPDVRQHEGAVGGDDLQREQGAEQRDHSGAGERPDDGAVAAEDRAAADDDRGDAVKLAELAGGRCETA